jgi:glycosyltransferase involved in cell wall biosynthesis
LPVVSTDVGGVAEMVRNGETGLLVRQNDPVATAEAIARLIGNVELAQSFGRQGRKRAQELFSIQTNVHALRKILGL